GARPGPGPPSARRDRRFSRTPGLLRSWTPGRRREHPPWPCRALSDHSRHEGFKVMSVSDTAVAAATARRHSAPLVRDAAPADYPAIRRVLIAAYRQYADLIALDIFSPYLADLLDLDKHARHGRLLVVEADGRIRG